MRLLLYNPRVSIKDIDREFSLNISTGTTISVFPDIPSIRQAERLYAPDGVWGELFFTFSKLSHRVNMYSSDRKIPASRLTRLIMMEGLLRDWKGSADGGDFLKKGSYLRDLASFILEIVAELKQEKVSKEDLNRVANSSCFSDLPKKLFWLSELFQNYQNNFKERGFADDIDLLYRLSSEISRQNLLDFFPYMNVNRVVFFGFSDFTPTQIDVIAAFDDIFDDVFVAMPSFFDQKDLENQTIERMKKKVKNLELVAQKMDTDCNKGYISADVVVESYRTVEDELESIAFRCKELICEKGFKPYEIAVVFRSIGNLSERLIHTFDKFGLPIRMENARNLRDTVFGHLIKDLIEVKNSDFAREKILKFFRNVIVFEYLKNKSKVKNDTIFSLLNKIEKESSSLDLRVYKGKERWLDFFDRIKKERDEEEKVFSSMSWLIKKISSEFNTLKLSDLVSDISYFHDLFDIPEFLERVDTPNSNTHLVWWEEIKTFLREISFVSSDIDISFKSLDEFTSFFSKLLSERKCSYVTCETVEAIDVLDGLKVRGVGYRALFLVGMNEGAFPLPLRRDPIFKWYEREEINRLLGKEIFATDTIHFEKEEHLFKTIVAQAKEKLFVSYFRFDTQNDERNRSYLVDLILRELGPEKEVKDCSFRVVQDLSVAYSSSDLLRFIFSNKVEKKEDVYKLVENKDVFSSLEFLDYLLSGLKAEKERLSPTGSYTSFEGIVGEISSLPSHFSPTELEEYGNCPFKYFSSRILDVRKVEPVGDDINRFELGTLLHKVLCDFFREKLLKYFKKEKINSLTYEGLSSEYKEFLEKKEKEYDKYFSHLSDRSKSLLKTRVFEFLLPRFFDFELERIKEKGFLPSGFEKELAIDFRGIKIKGTVDRFDTDDHSRKVIVYDYKLGNIDQRRFYDYRNLQLPLYLYALSKCYEPYGGYYLSVTSLKEKGLDKEKKDFDQQIEEAKNLALFYAENIRKGIFPPFVGKKTLEGFIEQKNRLQYDISSFGVCSYCEYSDFCRVKDGVEREGIN